MTKSEAEIFIDEMESIGDVWTVEQVMDVYGNVTLEMALKDRKASVGTFMNNYKCCNSEITLDVIISVGYRVKSKRGIQFRIWVIGILKEYMRKGFVLDDDRLKNLGGGGYFKELLERIRDIRDIRASEKVFYRQILESYATSIDYDPKAEISIVFFKM